MPFQTTSTLDAVCANTMAGIDMAITTNDFNFIDFSFFIRLIIHKLSLLNLDQVLNCSF